MGAATFVVNDWLQTFGWPELEHINCCQKTWGDGPYGREKAFYRDDNSNRNALCTAAVGRMLEAVMTDAVLSPPLASACVIVCGVHWISPHAPRILRIRWMDFSEVVCRRSLSSGARPAG